MPVKNGTFRGIEENIVQGPIHGYLCHFSNNKSEKLEKEYPPQSQTRLTLAKKNNEN